MKNSKSTIPLAQDDRYYNLSPLDKVIFCAQFGELIQGIKIEKNEIPYIFRTFGSNNIKPNINTIKLSGDDEKLFKDAVATINKYQDPETTVEKLSKAITDIKKLLDNNPILEQDFITAINVVGPKERNSDENHAILQHYKVQSAKTLIEIDKLIDKHNKEQNSSHIIGDILKFIANIFLPASMKFEYTKDIAEKKNKSLTMMRKQILESGDIQIVHDYKAEMPAIQYTSHPFSFSDTGKVYKNVKKILEARDANIPQR